MNRDESVTFGDEISSQFLGRNLVPFRGTGFYRESRMRCLDSRFPAQPQRDAQNAKTCLHTEVRRFGTQACGNDNYSCGRILEMASNLLLILVFLQVLPILLEIFHV